MSSSPGKLKQLFFDIMGYVPEPGPEAKAAAKEAEKENKGKAEKPVAQMYQGRSMRSDLSWYSMLTGEYAVPLLEAG